MAARTASHGWGSAAREACRGAYLSNSARVLPVEITASAWRCVSTKHIDEAGTIHCLSEQRWCQTALTMTASSPNFRLST